MGYKKEEMKNKKCLKGSNKINNFIEKKKGFIYFIVFITILAIIPASAEGLTNLIKSLEYNILTTIIEYIFYFTFIISYLKMLIHNIKGVKYEKNTINKM